MIVKQTNLLLDIIKNPLEEAKIFDKQRFFVGNANEEAMNYLNNQYFDNKSFLLIGNNFSGKSHLRYIWQKNNNAVAINYDMDTNYRKLIDAYDYFYLEDLHLFPLKKQKLLFDLINIIIFEEKKSLLITSNKIPDNNWIKIPDLLSRLMAFLIIKIHDPDEDLMCKILYKRFQDFQITVDINVLRFITARIERNFETLENIFRKILDFSFEYNLPINFNVIKKILDAPH